ncbi:MAG: acyl-CoA dehydrogenase family protein [Candidatus Limnocylindrales bacterium]
MHDPALGEPDRLDGLRPELEAVLAEGLGRLQGLGRGPADGSFSPEVPRALAAAGLQRLVVPLGHGGLGAGLRETALVLAALGALDGSAALGLAMHCQIIGGALQASAGRWPLPLLRELLDGCATGGGWAGGAVAEERAGSAAVEERAGEPERGARLDTTAVPAADGTYRLDGQKPWVTWLPSLHRLLVMAAVEQGTGLFLVDPTTPGVEIEGRFESLSLRGSGSGQLGLRDVAVPADRLVSCRPRGRPDPRGPAPQAWFGLVVAATYLGVGEGGRAAVAAFAGGRRPSDAPRGIGAIPSVAVRLGRLDAALRVARLVVLETARRWDATPAGDAAAREALLDDVALAKVTATNAAVTATDEALRVCGGPGLVEGPLERAFRDARAGLIHPPLDDICYQSFARRLLGASEG